MQKIKPIETVYRAYRFRSRLEARWAVFFSELNIEWEYEKEGYELEDGSWYLPDFWLPKFKIWVEIKPGSEDEDKEAKKKCHLLAKMTRCPVVLIQGNPGSSDNVFPDFSMTAFGGEMWDMFINEEKYYPNHDLFERRWMGGAEYFEDLRQFVLIKIREGEFLSEKDMENMSIPFLDEVARRKVIVELDRLYYRRKHGKEHPRQFRSCGVCFGVYKAKLKATSLDTYLNPIDAPLYYQEIDETVRNALYKARSARFEHGEQP